MSHTLRDNCERDTLRDNDERPQLERQLESLAQKVRTDMWERQGQSMCLLTKKGSLVEARALRQKRTCHNVCFWKRGGPFSRDALCYVALRLFEPPFTRSFLFTGSWRA